MGKAALRSVMQVKCYKSWVHSKRRNRRTAETESQGMGLQTEICNRESRIFVFVCRLRPQETWGQFLKHWLATTHKSPLATSALASENLQRVQRASQILTCEHSQNHLQLSLRNSESTGRPFENWFWLTSAHKSIRKSFKKLAHGLGSPGLKSQKPSSLVQPQRQLLHGQFANATANSNAEHLRILATSRSKDHTFLYMKKKTVKETDKERHVWNWRLNIKRLVPWQPSATKVILMPL